MGNLNDDADLALLIELQARVMEAQKAAAAAPEGGVEALRLAAREGSLRRAWEAVRRRGFTPRQ